MRADYHMHTYYSPDSSYPMENVIKDAIDLGFEEICFTDHVDYGVDPDLDDLSYVKELLNYKEKYKDLINIKLGLEFGMQVHVIDRFEKLFKRHDFDFTILSVHAVDDLEISSLLYKKDRTQDQFQQDYYDSILQLVKSYKNYSVLGHLDAIVRYDKEGPYPFEKIKDKVTQILKIAIEDGKGIELNTSYVRYMIGDTTPSRDILKLYKQLGGKIISLGSDSHKIDHLGKYLEEAKVILKEIGFEYFCTFDKMKAIYHKL